MTARIPDTFTRADIYPLCIALGRQWCVSLGRAVDGVRPLTACKSGGPVYTIRRKIGACTVSRPGRQIATRGDSLNHAAEAILRDDRG